MVNHKRVERIYNEEGLWVRKRTRKRMKGAPRQALQPPVRPNQQWAMDFVSDALAEGRAIRTLNVVDVFTRGLGGTRKARDVEHGLDNLLIS